MFTYFKQKPKKRRKRHAKSIMKQPPGTCYLCVKLHNDYRFHEVRHEHHVYDGKNRQVSEANGFKVKLCWRHHMYSPEAVHNSPDSRKYMLLIQQDVQREFEKTHTREEFMTLIGKNYLED